MSGKPYWGFIIILIYCLLPTSSYGGGHDDCNICHKNAKEKEFDLIVKVEEKLFNPFTNKPYGKLDAFCLSCHKMSSKTSHPVGVVPSSKKILVPKEAMGFPGQEREISCLSCHNPHPDNENYKYLRWPTENRWNLAGFCINCHPSQGGPHQIVLRK
jgi:hypothetical protein